MPLGSQGRQNQAAGANLEAFFSYYCRLQGLLCVQNGVQVKHLRGSNKFIRMPSNLDWTVITKEGRCACVDTKNLQRTSFGLSALNPRQIALARQYAAFRVVSGFVVALRPLDAVVFFPAAVLTGRPRQSFTVADGVRLGSIDRFDPRLLFTAS